MGVNASAISTQYRNIILQPSLPPHETPFLKHEEIKQEKEEIPQEKIAEISLTPLIMSGLSYLMEELKIKIADYDEVMEYLLKYPDILDVMMKKSQSTREVFPDAKLVLEKYTDPEIDDEYLVLYIRYPSYDEETVKRLREGVRKIRREYKEAYKGLKGWFMIAYDFEPA